MFRKNGKPAPCAAPDRPPPARTPGPANIQPVSKKSPWNNLYYAVELPGVMKYIGLTSYSPGQTFGRSEAQYVWLRKELQKVGGRPAFVCNRKSLAVAGCLFANTTQSKWTGLCGGLPKRASQRRQPRCWLAAGEAVCLRAVALNTLTFTAAPSPIPTAADRPFEDALANCQLPRALVPQVGCRAIGGCGGGILSGAAVPLTPPRAPPMVGVRYR